MPRHATTEPTSPALLVPGDRIMHEGRVCTVVQVNAISSKRNGPTRTVRGYRVLVDNARNSPSGMITVAFGKTDMATQVRRLSRPAKTTVGPDGVERDVHGVPVYRKMDDMPPEIRAGFNRYYNRNEDTDMAAKTNRSTTRRKPTSDGTTKTAKPRAVRTVDIAALSDAHGEAIAGLLEKKEKWPAIQQKLNLTYAQAWLACTRFKNKKLVVTSAKVTPAWVKEQREQHNRAWGFLMAITAMTEDKLRALYREAGAVDKGQNVARTRSAGKTAATGKSTAGRKTAAAGSSKAAAASGVKRKGTGSSTTKSGAAAERTAAKRATTGTAKTTRRSGVKTTK